MELPLYQIDAFASAPFRGNPAAVVPLEAWLPDATLQAIAAENNLSETAFLVATPAGEQDFELRWFTPAAEVNLCGHATLATAWVLFHRLAWPGERIRFHSRSGELAVTRRGELLELDFPAQPGEAIDGRAGVAAALGVAAEAVQELLAASDWMAVLPDTATVHTLRPDFAAIAALPARGLIVTAPADVPDVHFVSRFFAPQVGIAEDPVTGSAHCTLVPYWSERLQVSELQARQVSARSGELLCRYDAVRQRVALAGRAFPFLEGRFSLPDPEPDSEPDR